MRSLKIIVFRDTDKPYTMIISSKVLIGITFGLVALISLLAFSVMGNVMLWNDNVLAENPPVVEADTTSANDEVPAENDQQNVQGNDAEENGTENNSSESVEEDNGGYDYEETDNGESEVPETFDEMVDNPYMAPGGSAHEAVMLGGPIVSSNSVQVNLEVRKRTELGIRAGGRLVAALVDSEGNVGSSLPRSIQYDGLQITNPERGTRFEIARRNTYNLDFQNVDTSQYSYLALFIYDELGTQLLWRNIIPLRR